MCDTVYSTTSDGRGFANDGSQGAEGDRRAAIRGANATGAGGLSLIMKRSGASVFITNPRLDKRRKHMTRSPGSAIAQATTTATATVGGRVLARCLMPFG